MINAINKIKQGKGLERDRDAGFDRRREKTSLKRLHLSKDVSEKWKRGRRGRKERGKGRGRGRGEGRRWCWEERHIRSTGNRKFEGPKAEPCLGLLRNPYGWSQVSKVVSRTVKTWSCRDCEGCSRNLKWNMWENEWRLLFVCCAFFFKEKEND